MKIEIHPDKEKSESLKEMARITLDRLEETNKEKYPSNTLTDYYDILHKLMEAITVKAGVKIKGEGAHRQLIDYIVEKQYINEQSRVFIQEIRDFRNKISYEGFIVNKDYILSNTKRIKSIINKLLSEAD